MHCCGGAEPSPCRALAPASPARPSGHKPRSVARSERSMCAASHQRTVASCATVEAEQAPRVAAENERLVPVGELALDDLPEQVAHPLPDRPRIEIGTERDPF